LLAATSLHAQILKLDTFMYSPSLDTVKMVDVILPPGYNQNPNTYYPVVYYLHGWTGDQNSNSSIVSYMNSYINQGKVEPFIMVKPSSWVEPFEGSVYLNSIVWGDYQEYVTTDLVAWVDSSFRTVPAKSHRGIIGNSMGCYGTFYLTEAHPELFRAAAGHAGTGYHYEMLDSVSGFFNAEQNGSPPYTYTFNVGSKPWTSVFMLFSAAINPNLSSTQTYVVPTIMDYPFDEYGAIIDSTMNKLMDQCPLHSVYKLDPADSVSYLYSCGTLDDWLQFEAMQAMVDSLQYYGIDAEWLPHSGNHTMPTVFKDRALLWLDSILGDPELIIGIPEPVVRAPEYRFWPNPANNELNLELEAGDESIVSAELYDIDGRLVRTLIPETRAAGAYNTRIDIRGLAYGTYLLHIRVGNRHIYDKQIIH
ncbi:MAG: T9SS type A sorting domain-containing protein, partial [Bacteroidales bacterium]|nr:T9SS type A sorting domain-containing protein [Bacteroidales bacterium]